VLNGAIRTEALRHPKLVEKAIRESAIDGREHFYIEPASTIVYKARCCRIR
jgi:hypothetical protein